MRIIKTTDGHYIGVNIGELPNIGDELMLGSFKFIVQAISHMDNSNVLLSNPNYQIELEE